MTQPKAMSEFEIARKNRKPPVSWGRVALAAVLLYLPAAIHAQTNTFPASGNVGIGTTNPTKTLSVNGTILAKEVIVQTGWADDVFTPGYKLNSLPETAAFIKANKHLPGIPSAEEVAANGANVGEMQVKLLAKVEELTLHMIAMDSKYRALEREKRALEEKVKRLESSALAGGGRDH